MKNLRLPAVLAFTALTIFSCSDEPKETPLTIGNLELSENKPSPGDSLKLAYSATDTITETFYVYTVKSNSYPEDFDLIKDGERFTGAIKIPDSADGLIFNFKVGEEYEANDEKGYSINLYNKTGEPISGSKASIAWYKLTRGSSYGIKTTPDSTLASITRTVDENPDLKADWLTTQMRIMNQVDPPAAATKIDEEIKAYTQNPELTKDDYQTLIALYQLKKNTSKSDSIQAIFIEKYPKSQLAQNVYAQQMQTAETTEERLKILEDFNTKVGVNGNQKNFLNRTLASTYMKEGDLENFKKYMALVSNDLSKAYALNNIAWDYAESGENLELAEELSKKSLDIVEAEKENKPDFYSARQYEQNLKSSIVMYSDTYAMIMFKQGKIKEAIAAQERAVADPTSSDVYERYIQFLIADEQYEKVVTKATEYIKDGKGTAVTKDYLKTAYTATEQEEDFDTYLSSLEKIAHDNALAELKKEMLDEEAPTFNLKNLKGEEIALADLKGKTVVLDFWATWCGPCKVSFPGMQKAVTKYADNEKVEFLFIDTWESTSGEAREKSVSDFIAENNYTFNVLMDTPQEEGSRAYDVVSAYEVDGIPTKFVVGPDGKIKFKAVGFDGSTDDLVEELDMMIGLASGQ